MKEELQKIKLWAFWYNPMTYESASYIESYHRTKKGALEAMKKHRAIQKEEWVKQDEWYRNDCKKSGHKYSQISKFGAHESWFVGRFDLTIEP